MANAEVDFNELTEYDSEEENAEKAASAQKKGQEGAK
jgi:hypothetical protein